MIKLFLGIIILILFSGVNITSGQENSLSPTNHTFSNKKSVAETGSHDPAAFNHLMALSNEEINSITGEGSGKLLTFNYNQTNLPWIILWDEISTQKNTSTNMTIELTRSGSFMHGIKENGIYK